ncbi:hypothetical protein D3C71_277660 [compost metagenome]
MTLCGSARTLTIATVIMAAAIAAYASYKERVTFAEIVADAYSIPFTLSCAADGSLDGRQAGNCFEKNGYRFIREGLGTIIARTNPDGSTSIVYRKDIADDGGSLSQLKAARNALAR